jgi:hypothetical protein
VKFKRKARTVTANDDILELLRKARMDYTAGVAKINEAIRLVAALPTSPDLTRKCPQCGVTTRGPLSLEEHLHTSHGGPLPEAWARAERLAGFATP